LLTISAVIPTKNRAADLRLAVQSILDQSHRPDELIIVDQSDTTESRAMVEGLCKGRPGVRLVYVHDRAVTGLVDAKRVGVERATGDIVSFLEDDVVLEPAYFEGVAWAFASRPDCLGCGGVITNPPRTSPVYVALQRIFLRGIFDDPRLDAFAEAARRPDALVPCHVVSGGVSSWRRAVFQAVPFDVANGFHFFEDMEFATRVVRTLGPHLYINPRARLAHYGSPVNRDRNGRRQQRKMAEAITFARKRADWPGATSGIALGSLWWLAEAAWQSVRLMSIGPLVGYVRGVHEGRRRVLAR
jgi:glycosyltransferase involved in cell wall biosynthesis